MRNEIKEKLTNLKIEAKETRKKKTRNSLIFFALALICYLISFGPQLSGFIALSALIAFFGGMYVVLEAIPSLIQPLSKSSYAFKKIVSAIETLEDSKSELAYKEAYNCLKKAHSLLEEIELDELDWYESINQIVEQFLENLQLIVLPATKSSKIRTEDLEEIAIALASSTPSEMAEINKQLETNPTYTKIEPPPPISKVFFKRVKENTVMKIAYSLFLGYGFILIACLIFSLAASEDYSLFLTAHPDIVILGGLAASGITFWKT